MKTSFIVHASTDSLDNDFPVLYFKKEYLKIQEHSDLLCYENEQFFLPIALDQGLAISIPRSPFGSFFLKDNCELDVFLSFVNQVKNDLKSRGVSHLNLIHPPKNYTGYIREDWLASAGFAKKFSDINQHIPLHSNWEDEIHEMQRRKLTALENEGFEFKKMDADELEKAHQFVKVCRIAQELSINISYEILKQLSDQTEAYDLFGVFRDNKISALCIAARVTKKTAYYYLPATSPMFRSQSPMVLLIAGMVAYYRSAGFESFDLGISSIEGRPQETLRIFKERMGASELTKTSWELPI
ncbi:MAG: GNAT family N-acetyltransferase [Cyclobacteriaceae bacterium]